MGKSKQLISSILPLKAIIYLVKAYYDFVYKAKKTLPAFPGFKNYSIRETLSVNEALTKYTSKFSVLDIFPVNMFYSEPLYFPDFKSNDLINDKTVSKYILKILGAEVSGESNLILLNDRHALYDLMYQWNDHNIYYFDPAIKKYSSGKEVLTITKNFKSELPSGIFLTGNFSSNYYHFIYEFIARLSYLDQAGLNKTIPLLVDENFNNIPQFKEILDLFNTDKRPIVPLSKNFSYKVFEMYYLSCPNHIVPHYTDISRIDPSDTIFDLSSLEYLRERFKPTGLKGVLPKRIYISRKNAGKRRAFNEDEVFDLLKKFGFTEVFPERHSVAEQMAFFRNAEVIVTGSGAALSNLIACNEGCKIICLINYRLTYSYFSTVASFVKAQMIYINDSTLEGKPLKDLHKSFKVELHKLKRVLNELNISEGPHHSIPLPQYDSR